MAENRKMFILHQSHMAPVISVITFESADFFVFMELKS